MPLGVLLAGIVLAIWYQEAIKEKIILETWERHRINLLKITLFKDVESIVSDVLVLAESHEYEEVTEYGNSDEFQDLADDYLAFFKRKGVYDQVRFINVDGLEIIRISYNAGKPVLVPVDKLQSKAHRYYFQKAMRLKHGEVYVSPFDLNMEHNEIERPYKPMIRFAAPVFNSHGERLGVVVMNYLGVKLLNHFQMVHVASPGRVMLLNKDGYWLHSHDPEEEWGFMFEEKKGRTFGNSYLGAWHRITKEKSGQFSTADGMFTFETFYLLQEIKSPEIGTNLVPDDSDGKQKAGQYYWKIVSHCPPEILNSGNHQFLLRTLLPLYFAAILILAVGSWLLAKAGITRKITEEALKENVAKYRQVHATAFDGIIIANSDGNIVETNRKAEEIFGYEDGELTGSDLVCLIPESLRDRHLAGIKRFLETGESRVQGKIVELEGVRKKGEIFPVELTIAHFSVEGHAYFSGTIRDITNRKLGEKKLLLAKKEAETANRAKSDFLSNMSHELRTPLTSILGFANLLLDGNISEKERKCLKIIHTSGSNLMVIINEILDLFNVESGKMELEETFFDLRVTLEKSLKPLTRKAEEKRLGLFVLFGPNIPDGLIGDPGRLRQIILNLVGNAVKFTDTGKVTVECKMETESCGLGSEKNNPKCQESKTSIFPAKTCLLHFSVRDSGIGIPKNKQEVIFESFRQADGSSTRKYGGTGLGTAISKSLVELMGGKIWLESEEGEGSNFQFILPFKCLACEPKPKKNMSEQIGSPQEAGEEETEKKPESSRPLNILFAEDDPPSQLLIKTALEDVGHCVEIAENGKEALEKWKQGEFDLILMDIQMPLINGWVATKTIRDFERGLQVGETSTKSNKSASHVPIIALTAFAMAEDEKECLNAGMDDYISKPVDLEEMIQKINKWGLAQ